MVEGEEERDKASTRIMHAIHFHARKYAARKYAARKYPARSDTGTARGRTFALPSCCTQFNPVSPS